MKKNKVFLSLSLILLQTIFFAGCQSSKTVDSDDYISEDASSIESTTVKVPSTKKSNFWDSFWGKDKYTEIGDATIYTTNAIFALENKDAVIAIQNKANTVGFGSPYLASYYYVTFDDFNRNLLISDINKYLSDFEEKKLNRDDSKSFKTYGSVNARLDWGTIKSSTPNYANAKVYVGYKFKGKSPYFTLTIYSTANQKFLKGDDSAVEESLNLSYYMTKAQGKALSELLSDSYVANAINKINAPVTSEVGDDY